MKVIYMHGIGAHNRSDKLDWDLALFGRDMGAQTMFAYWSDLRPLDFSTFAVDFSTAKALHDSLPNERLYKLATDLAADLRQVKAMTVKPDEKFPDVPDAVADAILKLLLKDVGIYFFDATRRSEIKARLLALLTDGEEYIVIGHSMGSVITYDVLRTFAGSAVSVPLYLTLGSPLGLPTIQRHLKVLAELNEVDKLPCPIKPQVWHNFASYGDPVCSDMTLANEFAVADGQTILDHQVVNPDVFVLNPHSVTGYLSLAVVKETVSEFIS